MLSDNPALDPPRRVHVNCHRFRHERSPINILPLWDLSHYSHLFSYTALFAQPSYFQPCMGIWVAEKKIYLLVMESTGLAEPFWYIIIATGGTFIILSTTVLVFVLCRYQQDRADRGQAVSAYWWEATAVPVLFSFSANDVYPDKRSSGGPDLWCRQDIELLKNNQPLTFGNSSSSDQQIVPINMGFRHVLQQIIILEKVGNQFYAADGMIKADNAKGTLRNKICK